MARVLSASGNSVDAARARVAGDGFETVTDLYADHPFARAIIQRGVMTAYQHLREHEPPPAPDAADESRIIQP
jgi:deoxycytidylate deaminase